MFRLLGDEMGFRVGRLVGVEVGLRHSGQQLGSGLGFHGGETVGWGGLCLSTSRSRPSCL